MIDERMTSMSYTLKDAENLEDFLIGLMRTNGTGYFRGTEVRCEQTLTGHKWTMYGPKTTFFTTDIGPDELEYVSVRLAAAGIFAPVKN